MKRRKIQIGLIVLVLLMCCGINPKAWATTYEWDGAVWTIASTTTEVDLSNVTSADQLTIRNNGARLNTAGLKTTVAPNIYFALNSGDAITLDVPAGYSALGTVTGAPGGQYILKAFNPTLALGNVSVSGGWLRLKHNTGGSGAGTITTPQLWADNGGTIYVDTMSCVIGTATIIGSNAGESYVTPAVVAANGGNVTFTIGNSANLMNIRGSIITGASTAALAPPTSLPDYDAATDGVSVNLAAGVGFATNSATAATTVYGMTVPTSGSVGVISPTNTAQGDEAAPNTDMVLKIGGSISFTGATDHQWFARTYKATWKINYTGPLSSTPGTVNVIGTGTAAGSPNSDPSFVVTGKIYLNRFLSGTETRTYTHDGTAYEVWKVVADDGNNVAYPGGGNGGNLTARVATVLDLSTNAATTWADHTTAFWSLYSTVRSGTVALNDVTTDATKMATDYGAFNCTNAALYVAGSIDGGVNISDPSDAHSATLVGLPDGGTSLGKLDLRGTEVHLGASDPTTITTTQVASTFSALPADSVITDENTSFIFNGTVTDFFRSSLTAGRNLGSLYFRPATATEAAVLDTTGQDPSTTEDIKSALMALVDNNITLHGNLEVANQEDASLNLLAFGKGTITVNGYVDLGNTEPHVVPQGLNLIFNGAIRGWGSTLPSGSTMAANITAIKKVTVVTDDPTKAATDITGSATAPLDVAKDPASAADYVQLPNITIGVNGMEHGDSVTALPGGASAVGNLTINRAACDLTFIADLTVFGNLTINAGGLTAGATDADEVGLLRVLGDTRIERNGYLNLDVPEIAANAAAVTVGMHHRLGTHHTLPNSLTVNGLLSFEGFNPVDTLTVNGPIQPSQGALQANAHTMLILNGKTSYSLPATVTELLTLNYNIDDVTKTAAEQVNTLTLQADLEVDTLTNTSGILTLAGYKLTVNDVKTIDLPAANVGLINAVNGSALELNAKTAGLAADAYPLILLDETTDLTIKNFGWYVPAAAAPGTLFRVNNLTIIDDKIATTVAGSHAVDPMLNTNGAALMLAVEHDGTASTSANNTIASAEIMGNLNIINNGTAATDFAMVGAATAAALNIKNLTVHGDVVVTNNNADANLADLTKPGGAVLWTNLTNFTTYGQVTLGGTTMAGALFSTDEATTLNILGEAKRFEFPAKDASYHIGKLVLNRPAGARFNNMKNVFADADAANATIIGDAFIHYFGTVLAGSTEALVIELQNGDLNLNGNNITFANAIDYLQETPGNYVVNTGTSYFSLDVHMPVNASRATGEAATNPPNLTRGAILAWFGAGGATGPSVKQMESIGITGVSVSNARTALTAADDQYFASTVNPADYQRPLSNVRRYPKGTLIPDVGISAQRYYYINHSNAAKSIAATYDLTEVVGTENTMKFYIETVENVSPTSDAFSNAEELLGTTQISPSSTAVAGKISSQNFTAGKSYNATGGQLATSPKGYLFALASRPGGGGYKVWTGAVDSMWQVAGNWGPTPGAPGPLDQAIINRSTDTIVITGTATCADLMINGDDILIKGRALTAGANAILRTTGNIYNYGHSSIKGVDGNNRLDLQVNDPTNPIPTGVLTTVVSATETGDPNGNTGVWFDNVTVTTATLLPSDGMRISGNISLTGNSTMQQAPGQRVVLYGPNTTPKTLTVPMGNAAVFGDIVLTNQANMTTASSLMLKGKFDFEDAVSAWESTDGTITATYASVARSVDPSGTTGTTLALKDPDFSGGTASGNAIDSAVIDKHYPQVVWHNPGNARFIVNNIQIGANLPVNATVLNGSIGYEDDNGGGGSNGSVDEANREAGKTTITNEWGGYASPIGTITIAGTLDKIGTSVLEPMRTPYVSGGNGNYAVIFSSNRQTEISNGAGSVLRIPNLIVTPNTKLRTTSSFNISNHLEVQTNAEMLCNSGTVTFDGPTEMTIINVSDRTLVMNNMNVEGRVTTPSSWKLAGNLIVNSATTTLDGGTGLQGTPLTESYFEQTAGTITIQNGGQNRRLVDNMASAAKPIPNITFNKLALDATSRLTTGPQDATTVDEYNSSFVIMNRAANGTMASGIELAAGSGLFTQPIQGTVYFQTDGAILDTTAKWITNNNTPERMQFGNIFIAPEYAGNNVRTKSSFEVLGYDAAGIYDAEFLVAGGGANFEALEGTITFVGDTENEGTATISSLAPSKAQFANLRSNNMVTLKIADQSEIFVSENLIADGTSQFVAGTTETPARVELNGKTAAQHLTGTTTEAIPFSFTSLLINKGQAPSSNYATAPYSDSTGVVVLDKNAQIITGSAGNQSELILSRGVLNLKNNALTVGANYITYQPGYSAIDGAEGRYIIAAGHETKKLEDPMFTIAGSPTLYNLDVTVDHQLANSLTVNNDLTLSNGILSLAPAGVAEVVEPKTLTLYGDLIQSGVASKLASGSKTPAYVPAGGYTDNTLTRLILKGTGTVQGGLRDDLFKDGTVFSITVARGETLGGDLTMDIVNGANLTIQTGVNTLNLGTNTLTLSDKTPTANSNGITIVSGNLTAADATVDFRNLTVVPANIFARSEVGSINFGTADPSPNHPEKVEIRGNVRVINALTIAGHPANDIFRIYTGNNKLTLLTPSPALNATHYVVGNLVMPVGNLNEAVFHVGSPAGYSPVTLRMGQGTAASFTPEILVTALNVDPTAGRGGNANNSINQTWTILPQVEFTDSLSAEFTFPGASEEELGITSMDNQFFSGNTFAAKWEEGHWRDYRTVINVLTEGTYNEVSGLLNRYPVVGSAALTGDWAIFAANANTDAAKNDAIAINKNKIVITELPTPVTTGISFAMTIALQDQYNQPVITANDLPIEIVFTNGGLKFAEADNTTTGGREAIIPAGQSTVEVTLQVDNSVPLSNSPVAQIKASATGTEAANWTPAISNYFPVIPTEPSNQAFDLTFTRATYTDVKVTWTNGDGENVIIVAKANGSLVIPDEMPRNGVTYVPNMVYGAGSNIGDAVVLYNGPSNGNQVKQSIDVAGLIPSTTYTLYAFAYNGTRGEESYNTSAAQRNPNSFSTSDGDDDDIAFGGRPHSNDSIVVSSTVGTNAPITGNVVDGSDYDCFNFTVTDEAPNVRVLLTNVPGDYTLELYDFTGRRIRRSTLLNESDEALVVNNLPAGTFVVKVFPVAANAETGEYKLLINTFSSEIFSVTPAPNMR